MVASKNEFLTKAKPLTVKIGEISMSGDVKLFATGSVGWYAGGRISIQLGKQMEVITLKVADQVLSLVPRKFEKSGNYGWHASSKLELPLPDGTTERTQVGCNITILGSAAVGGVTQDSLVTCQVGLNMNVVGSKELPMDAVPDTEVAPTTPSHPAPGKKQKSKQVA